MPGGGDECVVATVGVATQQPGLSRVAPGGGVLVGHPGPVPRVG